MPSSLNGRLFLNKNEVLVDYDFDRLYLSLFHPSRCKPSGHHFKCTQLSTDFERIHGHWHSVEPGKNLSTKIYTSHALVSVFLYFSFSHSVRLSSSLSCISERSIPFTNVDRKKDYLGLLMKSIK